MSLYCLNYGLACILKGFFHGEALLLHSVDSLYHGLLMYLLVSFEQPSALYLVLLEADARMGELDE